MSHPTRFLAAFALVGALAACSGGTRGVELTPNELAALPSFGEGNCPAYVENLTGRRIEVYYQIGMEEYKVRAPMETWNRMEWLEPQEAAVLRAPCDERQVVVGWRLDQLQVIPSIDEVIERHTLRPAQMIPVRLRRPSEASCSTANAQNSIRARCILG